MPSVQFSQYSRNKTQETAVKKNATEEEIKVFQFYPVQFRSISLLCSKYFVQDCCKTLLKIYIYLRACLEAINEKNDNLLSLKIPLIRMISISCFSQGVVSYVCVYGATAQKIKFSLNNFFSKCDEIRKKLRIWSHSLKKSLMENLIFCVV